MDGLQSVVTPIVLVVAIILWIYLYRRDLMPGPLNPETKLRIALIGVLLVVSASPLVDYTVDLASDVLIMGNPTVYPLSPSWVKSVQKISADHAELLADNDLDAVSRVKLQQTFTRRVEISYLRANAERGVYTLSNLLSIDNQLSKLTLAEASFRKSLECALVSLHGSFMSIDRKLIDGGLLPEINAATIGLSSYVPELRVRFEEVAATHSMVANLSLAFSQLCVMSNRERKDLEAQMVEHQPVYTWIGGNAVKVEAILYAISIMETLSQEVCAGWKAAILVGKQVHQFLVILEKSMYHIVEDEDWSTDGSVNFHGMLGKGITGIQDLYDDLAFTQERGDLFL